MARRRMILWRGISRLDKVTPIVALATYDDRAGKSSDNSKTGDMIQTWILLENISPWDAVQQGLDTAICGKCIHMSEAAGGVGDCYVNIIRQGPQRIWEAYRSREDRGEPGGIPFDPEAFRGRKVRFGSYGDPTAAPFALWKQIATVAGVGNITGYTHAWRENLRFRRFFMASCDHPQDYEEAADKGWRTFNIRPVGAPKPHGFVQCPASEEAGHKTVCASCMQCGGTDAGRTAHISIEAHGSKKNRFKLPLTVV